MTMNPDGLLARYIAAHSMPEEGFLQELDRETHLTCVHPRMLSGHIQGKILYLFCKMIRPKRILELGTYTAYSAISMGLALDDDAHIDTFEIQDELEGIITRAIEKAGLSRCIRCHFGNALERIGELEETYDLVFIDADKREYPEYYEKVFDKVKPGGYILADNVLWDGKVIDPTEKNDPQTQGILKFNAIVTNDSRVENVLFPLFDGMMVIRKK